MENWSMIVEQAAGRDQWLLDTVGQYIKEAHMPNVAYSQEYVASHPFGEKRKLLVVTHLRYRNYKMYISARNFGAHLDVSWYLTIEPRFLKRTLSKYTTGNPQALSQQVDIFDQQDLRAYVTVVHHIVKRVVDILLDELKQDPSPMELNSASKGFLSVW